jgi:hypothetical protein
MWYPYIAIKETKYYYIFETFSKCKIKNIKIFFFDLINVS